MNEMTEFQYWQFNALALAFGSLVVLVCLAESVYKNLCSDASRLKMIKRFWQKRNYTALFFGISEIAIFLAYMAFGIGVGYIAYICSEKISNTADVQGWFTFFKLLGVMYAGSLILRMTGKWIEKDMERISEKVNKIS